MDEMSMLDKLQNEAIKSNGKNNKTNLQKYNFDKMSMFFGEDYSVKGINISVPTIGDILKIGMDKFYNSLSPFLLNSTSIRLLLWEMGKDWNKVKDIEVFYFLMNLPNQNNDNLKIVFKNFDIRSLDLVEIKRDENSEYELALYSKDKDIVLYEEDYMELAEYIRTMMNSHPKVEKVKGKTTKSWIIQEEKMNLANKKDNEKSLNLLSLVSSCVNHPGFKYKLEELKKVNICQFMDAVQRIQKYEQGIAALHGLFSGMVSGKDIPKETLNYMGDL